MSTSLAVDIGASSGRVIAGTIKNGKLSMQDIHRFSNTMVKDGPYECWDIERLYKEIVIGMKKAADLGLNPQSIGIDTWAVDYVLLDEKDELLMKPIAYRDSRTQSIIDDVQGVINQEALYDRTGIQYQPFNTIYQLYAHKKQEPTVYKKATTLLMIPDYLHFLLTGVKGSEYTNATTTQLVNAQSGNWDQDILNKLGIDQHLLPTIRMPGERLGRIKPEIREATGLDLDVILPPTHDTGSAVAAVPANEQALYISSGTWSLFGTEHDTPVNHHRARSYNLTNEGGYNKQFRLLKNIMGLWMIQELKREYDDAYSFAEFVELAKKSTYEEYISVNEEQFLRPASMKDAIRQVTRQNGVAAPESPGDFARCIFNSLAISYQRTAKEIEEATGTSFSTIHIIGGGSQNEWLNQLTADKSGKVVKAGPIEATALGNLVVQFIGIGHFQSLSEARQMIQHSFEIKTFRPNEEASL
ncbi:rhamnulokinase [Paenalkalicoccus suaedae]|uniref:Rhamnulokinase n=1 Tax=Paenalkalicoccus suaedae TaxID=2592382 RepID=A0A859FA36_9BACI|nr:rhamnulokinase [Paenalkalicoccus suaedae]QKS69757.1 rhamnulokinase [Paenalkalicoccus suaedae]